MKRAETIQEWKEQVQEYVTRRDAAMLEAGVKAGDRVEWHQVGPFSAVVHTGIIFIAKNEAPKVQLDGSRKTMPWHKGWKKP